VEQRIVRTSSRGVGVLAHVAQTTWKNGSDDAEAPSAISVARSVESFLVDVVFPIVVDRLDEHEAFRS